jgi:hypothetical protein
MEPKDIFNITLLTVITSVIWMSVSLYTTYNKKDNVEVGVEITRPLDLSKFDQQTLDELSVKVHYYK